jgi:hypothetical protein
MDPNKTLSNAGEIATGRKQFKDRITVALRCNADGSEKIKPLIISKFKRPRCFGNFLPRCFGNFLPNKICYYYNNQKAWMTIKVFEEWILQFNN